MFAVLASRIFGKLGCFQKYWEVVWLEYLTRSQGRKERKERKGRKERKRRMGRKGRGKRGVSALQIFASGTKPSDLIYILQQCWIKILPQTDIFCVDNLNFLGNISSANFLHQFNLATYISHFSRRPGEMQHPQCRLFASGSFHLHFTSKLYIRQKFRVQFADSTGVTSGHEGG